MTDTTEDTATNIRHRFGRAVKVERVRRDWTQQELADRAGLARNYISKIERGDASPSISTVQLLANAFSMPMSTLVEEE